jgi:hypothetical protein
MRGIGRFGSVDLHMILPENRFPLFGIMRVKRSGTPAGWPEAA